MDGRAFCAKLKSHPKLFPGDGPNKEMIQVVANLGDGVVLKWEIDPSSVLEHSWSRLEAVFLGHESPQIIRHEARISGYYSNLRNWNKSKIAELRDRHRGNYVVPEATVTA